MTTWSPDFLDGYEITELALPGVEPAAGEPTDVDVVATLIRKTSDRVARRAVLYLHGWNDYFFQTHLADYLSDLGYDFYALDLRRYGRSIRPGQFRGFITNLDDYSIELDAAADLIAADHDRLLLMGHSTGGLIAALWAARNVERLEGLILNSPWLDLQGSAIVRTLGTPVIDRLGSRAPTSIIRLPDLGFNARALHVSLGGEWDYDLMLKSTPGPAHSDRLAPRDLARASAGCRGAGDRCSDLGARLDDDGLLPALARGAAPRRHGARCGADRGAGCPPRTARHRGQNPGRSARSHVVRAARTQADAGRDRPVRRGVREARAFVRRWVCWRRCAH